MVDQTHVCLLSYNIFENPDAIILREKMDESYLNQCWPNVNLVQHFRIFINIFHTAKNHKKALYFTRKSAANIFPQKPKICTIGALSPSKKLRKIE